MGVDNSISRPISEELCNDYLKHLNPPDKFILYVGNLEPRKNLITLIKSYTQLPKRVRETYHLVIAGAKAWKYEELLKYFKDNADYIHYIGHVTD